jgi:hypothetical protein
MGKKTLATYILFSALLGLFLGGHQAKAYSALKKTAGLKTERYPFKLENRQCEAFLRLKGPYASVEVPLVWGTGNTMPEADLMKRVELVDEPPVFPETSSNGIAIFIHFYKNQRKLRIQAYATQDFKGPVGARADIIDFREAATACKEFVTSEGREFEVQYRVPIL